MIDTPAKADELLTTDLPCMRCGYNLRTRPPTDLCPECGLAIEQSIRLHPVIPDPARATLAFTLLAFAMTAPLINIAAYELIIHGMTFYILLRLVPLAGALFLWCGIRLLRAAQNRSRPRSALLRAMDLAALAYLLLSIIYFIDYVLPESLYPAWLNSGTPGQIAAWIIETCVREVARATTYVLLAVYLASWARRLGARHLAWISCAAFSLPVALVTLETLIDAYRIRFYTYHLGVHLPRGILVILGYTWYFEGVCAGALITMLIWGHRVATIRQTPHLTLAVG